MSSAGECCSFCQTDGVYSVGAVGFEFKSNRCGCCLNEPTTANYSTGFTIAGTVFGPLSKLSDSSDGSDTTDEPESDCGANKTECITAQCNTSTWTSGHAAVCHGTGDGVRNGMSSAGECCSFCQTDGVYSVGAVGFEFKSNRCGCCLNEPTTANYSTGFTIAGTVFGPLSKLSGSGDGSRDSKDGKADKDGIGGTDDSNSSNSSSNILIVAVVVVAVVLLFAGSFGGVKYFGQNGARGYGVHSNSGQIEEIDLSEA